MGCDAPNARILSDTPCNARRNARGITHILIFCSVVPAPHRRRRCGRACLAQPRSHRASEHVTPTPSGYAYCTQDSQRTQTASDCEPCQRRGTLFTGEWKLRHRNPVIGECGKILVGFGVVSVVDTVAIGHSGRDRVPLRGDVDSDRHRDRVHVRCPSCAGGGGVLPDIEGVHRIRAELWGCQLDRCVSKGSSHLRAIGEPVAECQRRVREAYRPHWSHLLR